MKSTFFITTLLITSILATKAFADTYQNKYDEKGRLIEVNDYGDITKYNYDDVAGTKTVLRYDGRDLRGETTYDADGHFLHGVDYDADTDYYPDGRSYASATYVETTNDEGLRIKTQYSCSETECSVATGRLSAQYTYNQDGTLKEYISTFDSNGNPRYKQGYEYETADDGNKIEKKTGYTLKNGQWLPNSIAVWGNSAIGYHDDTSITKYDDHGNPIYTYSSSIMRHTIYNNEYDQYGNLIAVKQKMCVPDGLYSNDKYNICKEMLNTIDWDSASGVYKTSYGNTYYLKGDDGSTTIRDQNGKLIGYKGKRIYTIEEASRLSKPTGNTFKLRYK